MFNALPATMGRGTSLLYIVDLYFIKPQTNTNSSILERKTNAKTKTNTQIMVNPMVDTGGWAPLREYQI